MSYPAIPAGFGVPFIDLLTKLLPAATMTALDARYIPADTGWTEIAAGSFATGWSAVATDKPRVRRVGKRVDLTGAATRGTGGGLDNILTLPAGFRLVGPYTITNVGGGATSGNVAVQFVVNADVHRLGLRATPSVPSGTVVYISASWFID